MNGLRLSTFEYEHALKLGAYYDTARDVYFPSSQSATLLKFHVLPAKIVSFLRFSAELRRLQGMGLNLAFRLLSQGIELLG